jgi:hypothetical protein
MRFEACFKIALERKKKRTSCKSETVELAKGVEPLTTGLQNRSSTTELS